MYLYFILNRVIKNLIDAFDFVNALTTETIRKRKEKE